jgi:hypothetical protein
MEVGNWLARWVREHQRHDLELAEHVRSTKGGKPGKGVP